MPLPYNENLIARAKELRRDATEEEKKLWYNYLRGYPVRFQRQKAISSFIVDFYCHKAQLIIEVDGAQHRTDQGIAYDEERSQLLAQYGLVVIRFMNKQVNESFSEVCKTIDSCVGERIGRAIAQEETGAKAPS